MNVRVLLADDQALVRSGFRVLLAQDPTIEVVGEAGDGAAAVALAGTLRPDVVPPTYYSAWPSWRAPGSDYG